MSYEVVAPLVLAKDQAGKVGYHYRGTSIPWLSEDDARRLVADGFVLPGDSLPPAHDGDPVVRPAKNHSKDLWVEYAVAQGWDREVADSTKKADLVAALSDETAAGDGQDEDTDTGDGDDSDADDVESDGDTVAAPLKAATLEEWVQYAQDRGLSADEIEGLDKQELVELLT